MLTLNLEKIIILVSLTAMELNFNEFTLEGMHEKGTVVICETGNLLSLYLKTE
jgi:hypothetical protein